jgi:hypothetical protein
MTDASQIPGNPFQRPAWGRRWSFSLWDLMHLVLAAAVATAMCKDVVAAVADTWRILLDPDRSGGMFQSKREEILFGIAGMAGSLVAPLAALLALSLVTQAARIFLASRKDVFPSWAERFSGGFQGLGRVGLAVILLGCVLVDDIITAERLGLTVADELYWPQAAAALRRAVLIVAMMASLGWNRRTRPSRVPGRAEQWFYGIIVLPVAALFAMVLWSDSSIIVRLVHIAVLGMEMSAPLKFADPTISVLPMERIGHFIQVAALTSIVSLASLFCCHVLISWPKLIRVWRILLGATLIAGWITQAVFLRWVYWDGCLFAVPRVAARHGDSAWARGGNRDPPDPLAGGDIRLSRLRAAARRRFGSFILAAEVEFP